MHRPYARVLYVLGVTTPEQLLAMPLHAVTEVYGEAGLRERFALEVAELPGRSTMEDALVWAAALHADQRRTREPYLNHVLRVAIRILTYYRVADPEVISAALLHDAVEDQPWGMVGRAPDEGPRPVDESLAAVAARFGERTARLVAAVTNPEYTPDRDKDEQYLEHVRDSLAREPWARVLKLSDFTDNGVGVIHAVGPKLRRAAEKYAPVVPVLRDLLALPDTPLEPAVKEHIGRQLDLAESRFAVILADPPTA